MTGEIALRRLAVIFAADVVGFSAQMEVDEEGTYRRVELFRREVLVPCLSNYGGRLVKSMGDGFLVEFASPVEAVRCAMAVQDALSADSNSLQLRIGLNLGDVLVDDGGDVYGEGVNIAARLEGSADPGGILVSEKIYLEAFGKVQAEFEDRGEKHVKNISKPIHAFAIRRSAGSKEARSGEMILQIPTKPSIAVLPFQNMSGDPEQEYFADGIVEEIITELSRFKSLFVIARNSTFTYKGKSIDIKRVGRELGVRYVLEGSVRKAGHQVRITGQLIEAATEHHIWADKFDGSLDDVFGLQDRITRNVVGLIAPKLEQAEIERAKQKPTESLQSYDFYLRGLAMLNKRALVEAETLFRRAFQADSEYSAAKAMTAWTLLSHQTVSGIPLTEPERREALDLANIAAKEADEDAFVLARAGHILTYLGQEHDRGTVLVEQAISMNPNLGAAWYARGWVAVMCGDAEKAIESFDRLLRLSPLDPLRGRAWTGTAFALFLLERFDEGAFVARKSIQVGADVHAIGGYIANAIRAGQIAEAREAAVKLLELQPSFRLASIPRAFPARSDSFRERLSIAFRDAGIPE
jgi:adenylate cyclase